MTPRWPVLVAAVVCLPAVGGLGGELARMHEPSAGAFLVLGAVAIAALVACAWQPRLVVLVGAASVAGLAITPFGPPVALLPLMAALVTAILRGAPRFAIGTAVAAVVLPVVDLAATASSLVALRAVGECLLLGLALAAGFALRARARRREDERTAAEAEARAALEQERLRIARELHDVLAHSLSAISVQAGVGLHLAESRPDAAREALAAIRTASTSALGEVRQVIGILRGDESAPLAPEPDLDGVASLVADAASLGLEATLDDRLQPRPAPAVQLAVHRIVQESLTNAARHAGGSRVSVTLERAAGAVLARVRDSGGSAPTLPAGPTGRGVVGMRERAALAGGTLELVPHADGLEVVARIPEVRP